MLFETISSRCWPIAFDPLSIEDVTKILVEYFHIENEKAYVAAQFSSGSVINATELLKYDIEVLTELTLKILRFAVTLKIHSAIKELSDYKRNNSVESLKLIIKMLIFWLDDVQKGRDGSTSYYFIKNMENINKFNKNFPNANIEYIIIALNKILESIENNVNLNVATLNLIFELTSLRN